jgi:hypothetical protein
MKLTSKDVNINLIVQFEILQPKWDGWFAEGIVQPDGRHLDLYSATGNFLTTLDTVGLPGGTKTRGEYMYGTNAAVKDKANYLRYKVYDLVESGRYKERYTELERWMIQLTSIPNNKIDLTPCYTADYFLYLLEEVKAQRLEGVIGRMFGDMEYEYIHRYKPNFCKDYVLVDITEGNGRLAGTTGALCGAQMHNGRLEHVCDVAGMNDTLRNDIWANKGKYMGKVFEAEGSRCFDSGALRHPRFKRWRLDMTPDQVIWDGANGRYAE